MWYLSNGAHCAEEEAQRLALLSSSRQTSPSYHLWPISKR